jgi:hypothetical protein
MNALGEIVVNNPESAKEALILLSPLLNIIRKVN